MCFHLSIRPVSLMRERMRQISNISRCRLTSVSLVFLALFNIAVSTESLCNTERDGKMVMNFK